MAAIVDSGWYNVSQKNDDPMSRPGNASKCCPVDLSIIRRDGHLTKRVLNNGKWDGIDLD